MVVLVGIAQKAVGFDLNVTNLMGAHCTPTYLTLPPVQMK